MPIFEYKAIGAGGKTKTGVLDADNPKDARNKLRAQGIHVTSIKEIEAGKKNRRGSWNPFSRKSASDMAIITRQLATLLESGIPLREAIGALIEQIEDIYLQEAFKDIREQITGGKTLANAFGSHPNYFSDMYINMVGAGEAAGNLDVVLKKVADYLQSQNRMQGKVAAALAYPVVMMFIGVGVVLFLMTFVVPKIQGVLMAQKKALPLPTKILVASSDFCKNWWFLIIIGVIAIILGIKAIIATKWGKRKYDLLRISLPIVGMLFKKQAVSRFAVTFSALLQSGIPALDALRIVRMIVDNVIMMETLNEVEKNIIEGGEISAPFRKSKAFPPMVGYMMSVGEKTGQMDTILAKIAQAYDEEVELTAQKVTSILEPLMIVSLSVVVGFIVLAIILPIMEMSKI